MISQTVEYALRAVVCLAGADEGRLTTPQIAEATQVPGGYLSKVLQALGRARLVKSQRGLGGGFVLARRPDQISLLEVVNAVDPFQRIACCPINHPEHEHELCSLHRRLDAALEAVEKAFAETTLSELLAEGNPLPLPESIRASLK